MAPSAKVVHPRALRHGWSLPQTQLRQPSPSVGGWEYRSCLGQTSRHTRHKRALPWLRRRCRRCRSTEHGVTTVRHLPFPMESESSTAQMRSLRAMPRRRWVAAASTESCAWCLRELTIPPATPTQSGPWKPSPLPKLRCVSAHRGRAATHPTTDLRPPASGQWCADDCHRKMSHSPVISSPSLRTPLMSSAEKSHPDACGHTRWPRSAPRGPRQPAPTR
mmetsp:Transcript_24665/g.64282  ORF Transcript_24665/g.64282 Transcript_24665/m.64282 type:complete len:220 (+) Transcript_24665:1449-2108(+)